jgi:hypothetical protein
MRSFKICNRLIGLSILLGSSLAASSVMFAQTTPTAAEQHPFGVWDNWKSQPDKSPFDPHNIEGVWSANVRVTTGKEVSPMTPAGKAAFDANKPFQACAGYTAAGSPCGGKIVPIEESNDPMIMCDPLGFPRNVFYEIRHMEFVQTRSKVVQLMQYNAAWREIWTDGRKLPTNVGKAGGPDPRWYGYSVGRWDGNTFVVGTVGLDERSWLDAYGNPHSGDMRVEERYTRVDHDRLKITVLVDDPTFYTKPFLAQPGMVFKLEPTLTLPEQICVPSEGDLYRSFAAGAVGKSK